MERMTDPDRDRQIAGAQKNIPGWGIDANPDDHPNAPMKHYNGADHQRLNYTRPPLQPVNMEILHSNERPNHTAAFGTSAPPSGLSGRLRRYAFKFSEGHSGHWMTLILADRINAVEGIIDDLKQGHIPNIFAERGWKAEWRFNRRGFITKVATGVLITTIGIALLAGKNKRRL